MEKHLKELTRENSSQAILRKEVKSTSRPMKTSKRGGSFGSRKVWRILLLPCPTPWAFQFFTWPWSLVWSLWKGLTLEPRTRCTPLARRKLRILIGSSTFSWLLTASVSLPLPTERCTVLRPTWAARWWGSLKSFAFLCCSMLFWVPSRWSLSVWFVSFRPTPLPTLIPLRSSQARTPQTITRGKFTWWRSALEKTGLYSKETRLNGWSLSCWCSSRSC